MAGYIGCPGESIGKRCGTFFLIFCLVHCGIEVGNPHDDGDDVDESRLTIEITDAPVDEVSHVYLNIEELYLIGTDDYMYDLELETSGPLDILSLQDGVTSVLVNNQPVGISAHKGYYIKLNEEKPGSVVNQAGETMNLILSGGQSFIKIEDEGDLTASQEIVLHFDLRQSLNQDPDGNYSIDAVIHTIRKDRSATLSGSISGADKGILCAYLESDSGLSFVGPSGPDQNVAGAGMSLNPGRVPPPPPSPPDYEGGAGEQTQFDPKRQQRPADQEQQVSRKPKTGLRPEKPDASRICSDAFMGVPLKDGGKFAFHYLKPGSYRLRLFVSDSEYYDFSENFSLPSGDHIKTGALNPEP